MEKTQEEMQNCPGGYALHLGFKIAKTVLKAALVCAAWHGVKELHKIHKAIEYRK